EVVSLGLKIRPVRSADFRSFIPIEPEPAKRVQDGREGLVDVPLAVRVVDPQDELPAIVPRPQPVEQRRPHAADVHVTRGGRSESCAYSHRKFQLINNGVEPHIASARLNASVRRNVWASRGPRRQSADGVIAERRTHPFYWRQ